ncbi:MAG TPA: lysylphosphatidylglycerol synthase transmembrane domain-containing protein, partial [Vicinamibacterales bacterium]|nr:lysylphosphatidylglycerol synthase transmembrane domain-containing protein [Vicinamibacterales bacterium]
MIVAVGLTAFVLWKADPQSVAAAAAGADPRWIAAAIVLVIFDRLLMALRWVILLRALDSPHPPPLGQVLRIFFVSTFVGTFLPSVGGDVYRAYSLARHGVSGAQSAASVAMDRLLGVLSLLVVAVIGLPFAGRVAAEPVILWTMGFTVTGCAVGALTVFSTRAARAAHAINARLQSGSLQRMSARLIDAVARYKHHRGDLASVLALSIGVQGIRIAQAWFLGLSLAIAAPASAYVAFVPIILLIMLLPITVYGLGTSQFAFDSLFALVGV